MKLPQNDDAGFLPLPVGGFNEAGTPVQGRTTTESLLAKFGDLVVSNEGEPLTENEYNAIIQRCEENGWNAWKASWEHWYSEGMV